jgi:hypothetical protein
MERNMEPIEPAIDDLARVLDETGPRESARIPATEVAGNADPDGEVEVALKLIAADDDLLLDPWFFKTEEEIAAIEDDPTARVIEIRIEKSDRLEEQDVRWEDVRWAS